MARSKAPKALPAHLKKYVVTQDYNQYSDEDQAVWRYIMRQLKNHLRHHAHPCYVDGLAKTGLSTEDIPKISEMDKNLRKFGWGAIPVSGFIPPAAFMEFQALGYLPIASEMRSVDHIRYTPAPDIVHEAAGHAPILIDKNFSAYLRAYAEVAAKSIISADDLKIYESIRLLSDAKEDPNSTPKKIERLEANLTKNIKSMRFVSEAGYLSRMNWWTAEYGLIGKIDKPKIFGAGLLSSIGESRDCLGDSVKKIEFDIDCIEYNYDITEPQPQLFVTPTFDRLTEVLEELSKRMAYRRGGVFGLDKAIEAESVNTVELDTGLQISGVCESYFNRQDQVDFIKLQGPCQLSVLGKELKGHGVKYHSHGYSSPLGKLKTSKKCLSNMTATELKKLGLQKNKLCVLEFESGIILSGRLVNYLKYKSKNLVFGFKDCSLVYNNELLFHPSWGQFDMACGTKVTSVFGGPADPKTFGELTSFQVTKIPTKKLTLKRQKLMEAYRRSRKLRAKAHATGTAPLDELESLFNSYRKSFKESWLLGLEIYELSLLQDNVEIQRAILDSLRSQHWSEDHKSFLEDGISIAAERL